METGTRHVIFATWLGMIANLLLTLIKGIIGYFSGSRALLADAAHSASDIIGSIVVLFGVKIATQPPDEEHPYGHGKAEHVASLIVALILILIGVQFAGTSLKIFFGEPPAAPAPVALIVITFSIIVKEVLFQYKHRLGNKYKSVALLTEAWHHRSDAFSSVAALIGVGAARLGDYFDIPMLLYSDALAGVIVSFIVIKVGFSLAKKSSLVVMEQVLNESEIRKYANTAKSVGGVMRIDQLHARSHGHYIIIDIKVSVDPYLTVEAGHSIAARVKEQLRVAHPEVEDVLVHVNPYN